MSTYGTAAIVDNVDILVHDAGSGRLVDRQTTHNLITNTGLDIIRDILAEPDSATRSTFLNVYMAWGAGTTAADPGDIALETPASDGKKAITEANTDTNYQILYKYYMSSTTGNTDPTVAEVGLFFGNLVGSTTMFARATLGSTITKDTSKTITFNWTITISAS
jgi:hypothetical protein